MNRLRARFAGFLALAGLAASAFVRADDPAPVVVAPVAAAPPPTLATNAGPTLEETARILRGALPGLPEVPSGVTNVEVYLASLAPRVLLQEPAAAADTPPVVRRALYAGNIGYVRVGAVERDLAAALPEAVEALHRSNELAGLVLDLRFASGRDFQAAAAAAGAFAARKLEGFRLGTNELAIEPRAGLKALPVMVLANRRTRGAAEFLAAAVRAAAPTGLLLGSPSAGHSRTYREVDLGGGRRVFVETDPAFFGPRGEAPRDGLAPDLAVVVPEADEEMYITNEFRRLVGGRTVGRDFSVRLNEAELVRRRRSGRRGADPWNPARPVPGHPDTTDPASTTPPTDAAGSTGGVAVQDPVLGRALDLLSGLADQTSAASTNAASGDSR